MKALPARFLTYLLERFHPLQFLVLSLLMSVVLIRGTMLLGPFGVSVGTYVISCGALLLFLLHLRIFDEFKDHAHDIFHYPERPLPRGLVTKKELGGALVVVVSAEVGIALLGGMWSLGVFLLAFSYSLLMYKEFFVRAWLRERYMLYVLSHEVLIIPLFFYIASFATDGVGRLWSPTFVVTLAFVGSQLFMLEVARKVRAKERENASRDSYTGQYGVPRATALMLFLAYSSAASAFFLEWKIFHDSRGGLSSTMLIAAGILTIFAAIFIRRPTVRNSSRLFLSTVAYFVVTHVAFVLWTVTRA